MSECSPEEYKGAGERLLRYLNQYIQVTYARPEDKRARYDDLRNSAVCLFDSLKGCMVMYSEDEVDEMGVFDQIERAIAFARGSGGDPRKPSPPKC